MVLSIARGKREREREEREREMERERNDSYSLASLLVYRTTHF